MSGHAETIDSAAAAWIARRDAEGWTAQDQTSLDAWLDAATEHRVAFLRMDAAWKRADRLAATAPGEVSAPARKTATRWAAIAAGVAIIAASVLIVRGFAPEAYATGVGGSRTAILKDGSRMELNTDSRVEVRFSKTERRVRLAQGEAFFTVAADTGRPFVVEVGAYRIAATGTAFSVHREADRIAVRVRDGKVRIERADTETSIVKPCEFTTGAVIEARPESVRLVEVAPTAVEEALSWRRGLIVFDDTRLSDVAAEFNRYNDIKLVVADPDLAESRIGGAFRSTNIDAFVRIVSDNLGATARRDGDRILLQKS